MRGRDPLVVLGVNPDLRPLSEGDLPQVGPEVGEGSQLQVGVDGVAHDPVRRHRPEYLVVVENQRPDRVGVLGRKLRGKPPPLVIRLVLQRAAVVQDRDPPRAPPVAVDLAANPHATHAVEGDLSGNHVQAAVTARWGEVRPLAIGGEHGQDTFIEPGKGVRDPDVPLAVRGHVPHGDENEVVGSI